MYEAALRSPRVVYIGDNMIWVWLALACVATCITYLFLPEQLERSTIGHVLEPLVLVWNVSFGAGGVAILYGIFRDQPQVEAFGLCCFTGGLIVLSVAIVTATGPTVGAFTYPALAGAAVWRVLRLIRTTHPPEIPFDQEHA